MTLEIASFGIAVLGLFVAIAALAFGGEESKCVRQGLAALCFLLTLLFILVGVFSVFSDENNNEKPISTTQTIVEDKSPTPQPATQPSATVIPTYQIISGKRETLENYGAIYGQSGWCALWEHLINEGGVSGECPKPRYGQGNTDSNIEIVDGFVAKEGGYIAAFALQADTEIYVNYSHFQCVSFDPTSLSIKYILHSDRVTQVQANGWVASDISISGPFSIWLRCDGNWP